MYSSDVLLECYIPTCTVKLLPGGRHGNDLVGAGNCPMSHSPSKLRPMCDVSHNQSTCALCACLLPCPTEVSLSAALGNYSLLHNPHSHSPSMAAALISLGGDITPRIAFAIGLIAVVGFVGFILFHLRQQDPREPPYIHPGLPFIGHLIGMIRYGAKYFELVKYATSPFTQPDSYRLTSMCTLARIPTTQFLHCLCSQAAIIS